MCFFLFGQRILQEKMLSFQVAAHDIEVFINVLNQHSRVTQQTTGYTAILGMSECH